jgi:hypothetical protein
MADDFDAEEPEFDEEALEADDVDPEVLEEELEEEGFVLVDEDDDALVVEDEEEEDDADDRGPRVVVPPTGEDEDDDEDLVDPDDVEADLDTILKDRLVAADDEAPDDDEENEVDDRGDPVDRIAPKRPDEFVCQSCFLLKSPNQLADAKRKLCLDCV